MSEYSAFFGKLDIDSDNSGIIVDSTSTTLDEGSYYMYSPTAAESLLDVLCDKISEESAATVTYSISEDGVLTLSSASAFAMEFDSTLYADLGFASAVLSSATSHVATNQLKYCWFPEMLETDSLAPVTSAGKMSAVVNQQQASDKNVWTTKFGEIVRQELSYRYLPKAKAWKAATPDNSSWEEFYDTTYCEGRQMLFIPYWSDDETSAWYYAADLKAEVSPVVLRSVTGSDTYWYVRLYLLEVDA